MYYYMTKEGKFVDSSHKMKEDGYIQLNEQQYRVSRLIVKGYSQKEIKQAVDDVFKNLEVKEK